MIQTHGAQTHLRTLSQILTKYTDFKIFLLLALFVDPPVQEILIVQDTLRVIGAIWLSLAPYLAHLAGSSPSDFVRPVCVRSPPRYPR